MLGRPWTMWNVYETDLYFRVLTGPSSPALERRISPEDYYFRPAGNLRSLRVASFRAVSTVAAGLQGSAIRCHDLQRRRAELLNSFGVSTGWKRLWSVLVVIVVASLAA